MLVTFPLVIFLLTNFLFLVIFVPHRLQNSERERKQSDQSDKDMKVDLDGKVDALQKQLTDLDSLRLTHTV